MGNISKQNGENKQTKWLPWDENHMAGLVCAVGEVAVKGQVAVHKQQINNNSVCIFGKVQCRVW